VDELPGSELTTTQSAATSVIEINTVDTSNLVYTQCNDQNIPGATWCKKEVVIPQCVKDLTGKCSILDISSAPVVHVQQASLPVKAAVTQNHITPIAPQAVQDNTTWLPVSTGINKGTKAVINQVLHGYELDTDNSIGVNAVKYSGQNVIDLLHLSSN
jgi:hypothetical protein